MYIHDTHTYKLFFTSQLLGEGGETWWYDRLQRELLSSRGVSVRGDTELGHAPPAWSTLTTPNFISHQEVPQTPEENVPRQDSLVSL